MYIECLVQFFFYDKSLLNVGCYYSQCCDKVNGGFSEFIKEGVIYRNEDIK